MLSSGSCAEPVMWLVIWLTYCTGTGCNHCQTWKVRLSRIFRSTSRRLQVSREQNIEADAWSDKGGQERRNIGRMKVESGGRLFGKWFLGLELPHHEVWSGFVGECVHPRAWVAHRETVKNPCSWKASVGCGNQELCNVDGVKRQNDWQMYHFHCSQMVVVMPLFAWCIFRAFHKRALL